MILSNFELHGSLTAHCSLHPLRQEQYLIVELHRLCIVTVGFGLEGSAGDGLGPDLPPEDAADDVVILERSVKPGEVLGFFLS